MADYLELTTSFTKAAYKVFKGILDSDDALYMLLYILKTQVDQACLWHHFL